MRYLEDITYGEEIQFEGKYHVTAEEIIEIGKRWDPQPFHIDPEAAKASIFGGLVASSAHIFSIWVSMGHAEVDRPKKIESVSALGFNTLQWHNPVRPDDVLSATYKVIELRESKSKPHLGIVTSACKMENQRQEKVFTLECSFLVPKRNPG